MQNTITPLSESHPSCIRQLSSSHARPHRGWAMELSMLIILFQSLHLVYLVIILSVLLKNVWFVSYSHLFFPKPSQGKDPVLCPSSLVFQTFSLDLYLVGPHLLLAPSWRVWEIQKQRRRDGFVQASQSKQASPPTPRLSFAFPSSVSLLLLSCHLPPLSSSRNLSLVQLFSRSP